MQEVPAAAIPPGSLPPPPETDSVGFVILLAEHEEPSLAAKKMRQLGASSWATSTPKKRVWGFANTPSGRPSVEPLLSWETAAGSVQYTYQLASGRAEWLSSSSVYLPSGTDTVPVVATDAAGNVRTNKYQVTAAGGGTTTPTYDTDGNELSSGAGQAYTWDAKNEVMSIVYTSGANSGNHTEFAYDVLGRRISIIERTGTVVGSGTVTSTKQFVWDGMMLAEERNSSDTVTKRFYDLGEQISGTSYYYTKDHLGSIREMTNSSGAIQARYDYDPYGRPTLVSGTNLSDFQYAGYYQHQPSALNLTLFRAYSPNMARWLSRDSLGENVGPNLYDYVENNPVDLIDPLGLWQVTVTYGSGLAGQLTFGVNDGPTNFGFSIGFGKGFSLKFDPKCKDPNSPVGQTNPFGTASLRFTADTGVGEGGGTADGEVDAGMRGGAVNFDVYAGASGGVGIGGDGVGGTYGFEGQTGQSFQGTDASGNPGPFHSSGGFSEGGDTSNLFLGESSFVGVSVGFSGAKK